VFYNCKYVHQDFILVQCKLCLLSGSEQWPVASPCEHGNEPSVSMWCGRLHDWV